MLRPPLHKKQCFVETPLFVFPAFQKQPSGTRYVLGMAMIASLHVQDNIQLPNELETTAEADYTEFNIFRDYFGLHTIVKSIAAEYAPLEESTECEDVVELETYPHRRDSLGSTNTESSANSLMSVEVADICFNYNQDIRVMQAFAEIDDEVLSPLGGVFDFSGPKTNIPPSLFLNHSKLNTVSTAQLKRPQVCLC